MTGFILLLIGAGIAALLFGIAVYASESPELQRPETWGKGLGWGLLLLALVGLAVVATLWLAWRAL